MLPCWSSSCHLRKTCTVYKLHPLGKKMEVSRGLTRGLTCGTEKCFEARVSSHHTVNILSRFFHNSSSFSQQHQLPKEAFKMVSQWIAGTYRMFVVVRSLFQTSPFSDTFSAKWAAGCLVLLLLSWRLQHLPPNLFCSLSRVQVRLFWVSCIYEAVEWFQGGEKKKQYEQGEELL